MSNQTESASEYAPLLADLDWAACGMRTLDRLDAEAAAKAIRALAEEVRWLEGDKRSMRQMDDWLSARIHELRTDRDRLAAELAALREERTVLAAGLEAVDALIHDSYGVAGLHLNGEVASWESLLKGGQFEPWLMAYCDALEAVREPSQKIDTIDAARGAGGEG